MVDDLLISQAEEAKAYLENVDLSEARLRYNQGVVNGLLRLRHEVLRWAGEVEGD